MKTTYLLIEVKKEDQSIIEDIHGVSDNIEALKGVADEENWDEHLDWKLSFSGRTPVADRTKGNKTQFQILTTNHYKGRF